MSRTGKEALEAAASEASPSEEEAAEQQSEGSGFGRGGARRSSDPAPATFGPRFYSYNNLVGRETSTCGQAAIATVVDAFGLNPFRIPRTVRGRGMADDGRLHFDNTEIVGQLTRLYPPRNFFNLVEMTFREDIVRALSDMGLDTEERAPHSGSNGSEARQWLVDWVQRTRCPAIVLLDMPELGFAAHPYALHWGVVYALYQEGVLMASWHDNFAISWPDFMRGWHCKGIIYPNNYYQIQVGKRR